MFARAGIASRGRSGNLGGIFGRPKKKKPKEKFKCYVPFMWPPLIAVSVGMLILMGGTAMCVVGYYAKEFTKVDVGNETHVWKEVNPTAHRLMFNLTYVGPIIMGCGCFAIVISCVVVCETRDKMLKIMAQDKASGHKTNTKPDFYDLVIRNFRERKGKILRGGYQYDPNVNKENKKVSEDPEEGGSDSRPRSRFMSLFSRRASIRSTRSEPLYSHVGNGLKNIPLRIFTIDMDNARDTSLLPVSAKDRKRRYAASQDSALPSAPSDKSHKYPSASCLHELLKKNNDELGAFFSQQRQLPGNGDESGLPQRPASIANAPVSGVTVTVRNPQIYDNDTGSLCSVTVHAENGALDTGTKEIISTTNPGKPSVIRKDKNHKHLSVAICDERGAKHVKTSDVKSRENQQKPQSTSGPSVPTASVTDKPTYREPAHGNRSSKSCKDNSSTLHNTSPRPSSGKQTLPAVSTHDHNVRFNDKSLTGSHSRPWSAKSEDKRQNDSDPDESAQMRRLDSKATLSGVSPVIVDETDANCDQTQTSFEFLSDSDSLNLTDDIMQSFEPSGKFGGPRCSISGIDNTSFEESRGGSERSSSQDEQNPLLESPKLSNVKDSLKATNIPEKSDPSTDTKPKKQSLSKVTGPGKRPVSRVSMGASNTSNRPSSSVFIPYAQNSSLARNNSAMVAQQTTEPAAPIAHDKSVNLVPITRENRSQLLDNIRSSYISKLRSFTRHNFAIKPPTKQAISSKDSKHKAKEQKNFTKAKKV